MTPAALHIGSSVGGSVTLPRASARQPHPAGCSAPLLRCGRQRWAAHHVPKFEAAKDYIRNERPTANVRALQAASSAAPASGVPALVDLPLVPVLNRQGYVLHELDGPMEAAAFAIYDQNKKLQFVGFSKDLNHSLRTVFSRRPDKSVYFRAYTQEVMDQEGLGAARALWFESNGGPPPGNAVSIERNLWQKPFEAWATSDKGKLLAATESSKERLIAIKSRGCKEEFVPDPELLKDGKVDFLPAKELTAEQLAENKAKMKAIEDATRVTYIEVDGEAEEIRVFFKSIFHTNGGAMCDVTVVHDMRETTHRIIVGKEFYEPHGLTPEAVVECVCAFMLTKGMARHTEGILAGTEFPVNYFSVSELVQWNDDFKPFFSERILSGASFEGLPGGKAWRWARTEYYGHDNQDEDLEGLKVAFSDMAMPKEEEEELAH